MPAMLKRVIAPLAAVALLGAMAIIFYQARTISRQGGDLAQRANENRALRDRGRQGGREVQGGVPAAPSETAPSEVRRKWPPGSHSDELVAARFEVARLEKELAQARSAMEHANAGMAQLQDEAARSTVDNDKRAAATEARWKETLDTTNLTIESLKADVHEAKQQAAQLQAANENLKNSGAQSAAQAAEATRLLGQWQEVSRRRDSYLNDVLQRYREVTRSYRSMVGILNGRRNDQPGPVVDDAELGRIQSAITSAEDDMRQVEALNAQAALIQRKLAKR